jgi:hypothetical protein
MGKGKKERSKKNKNKKETREPIKRKFEGKKHCFQTHQIAGVSDSNLLATRRIKNKIEIPLSPEEYLMQQLMFIK